MTLVLTHQEAKEMLVAAGFGSAKNWVASKCQEKLAEFKELAIDGDDLKDDHPDEYKTYRKVAKAVKAGEAVTVEGGDVKEEKAKPKKADKAAPAKADDEKVPVKPKKTEKAPKAEKPPKEEGPEGVRESRTRPYLAGIIIAKHSGGTAKDKLLATGITEAMRDELDKAYGKKNPTESMFTLRNAWHAIRGAVSGKESELTKE